MTKNHKDNKSNNNMTNSSNENFNELIQEVLKDFRIFEKKKRIVKPQKKSIFQV